jgi:hypothetical protein
MNRVRKAVGIVLLLAGLLGRSHHGGALVEISVEINQAPCQNSELQR